MVGPKDSMLVATSVPVPGVRLVRLWGELDMRSAPEFADCVIDQLGLRPAHLILDLAAVDSLDLTTVGPLVWAHRTAEAGGTRLHLIGTATAAVHRLVLTAGLARLFDCQPTLDRALAEISTRRPTS
jgi:anti-anti-sigma factor